MMILLAVTAAAVQPDEAPALPLAAFGDNWEAIADSEGFIYNRWHDGHDREQRHFRSPRLTRSGGTTTLRTTTATGSPVLLRIRLGPCSYDSRVYPFGAELAVEGRQLRGCAEPTVAAGPITMKLGDFPLDTNIVAEGANPAWRRTFGTNRLGDAEDDGMIFGKEEPVVSGTTATYEVEREEGIVRATLRARTCRLPGRRAMPFTIEVRSGTVLQRGCARQAHFLPPIVVQNPPLTTMPPPPIVSSYQPPSPPLPTPPTLPQLRSGSITDADYPRSADRAGASGTVEIRVDVGPDGLITHCTIAGSSGNAALDTTTCELAQRRFRYEPGTRDGVPVSRPMTHFIRWTLPKD